MNIKEAKEEICHTVRAYTAKDERGHYRIPAVRQRPVLLIGPPGIGKTAIMEQAAKECNVGLVAYTMTHHTRQSAVGLPVVVHKTYQGKETAVTEYTMSEIVASVYECMEKSGCREGILFIDEINCVSETLAPTMLQLLQNKTFGTHRIPTGWVIVAAGNPPEYNKGAKEFDIVTLDRVKRMDVEADFEVWKEYAYEKKIHPAILSFLNLKNSRFYQIRNTAQGKEFVTARGWEDLSEILKSYEDMKISPTINLILQYLQEEETAGEFSDFYKIYEKYGQDYQIDQILDGTMDLPAYREKMNMASKAGTDERLMTAGMILAGWNELLIRYAEETEYLEKLHEALLSCKRELDENGKNLRQLTQERKRAFEIKRENGLLSDREEKLEERVIRAVEECALESEKERKKQKEEILDIMRKALERQKAEREEKISAVRIGLEKGYAFAGKAFGEGPEMELLTADLGRNAVAMEFIGRFGCEPFFTHSDALKLSGRRRELLERIERMTR